MLYIDKAPVYVSGMKIKKGEYLIIVFFDNNNRQWLTIKLILILYHFSSISFYFQFYARLKCRWLTIRHSGKILQLHHWHNAHADTLCLQLSSLQKQITQQFLSISTNYLLGSPIKYK